MISGSGEIDNQLGCPLSENPGDELREIYIQLLVGFDQIAKGNTYPGYALITNAEVGKPELDLIESNRSSLISAGARSSFYWRTAVLEGLSAARRRHIVLNRMTEWVAKHDPILFGAMKSMHLAVCSIDSAVLRFHWHTEHDCGKALSTFQNEHFESLRGTDHEDTAQRFGGTGP